MRSFSAIGLACFSLVVVGFAGGCGDNLAPKALVGGSGGAAGAGAGWQGRDGRRSNGRTRRNRRCRTDRRRGSWGSAGGTAGGSPFTGTGGDGQRGGNGGEQPGSGGSAGGGGGTAGAGGSGTAPVITFVTPTAASKLCAAGNSANGCVADADGTSAGWQGTITVKVTLDGVPVTTGNANLSVAGLALVAKPLDGAGTATFANSTLPEGATVPLVAQTDDIPGRGVGTASLNLLVNTIPPTGARLWSLVATPLDRRQTSFSLSWVSPADGERLSGCTMSASSPSTAAMRAVQS